MSPEMLSDAHTRRLVASRADFLRMRVTAFRGDMQLTGFCDTGYHVREIAAAAEALLAALERGA